MEELEWKSSPSEPSFPSMYKLQKPAINNKNIAPDTYSSVLGYTSPLLKNITELYNIKEYLYQKFHRFFKTWTSGYQMAFVGGTHSSLYHNSSF